MRLSYARIELHNFSDLHVSQMMDGVTYVLSPGESVDNVIPEVAQIFEQLALNKGVAAVVYSPGATKEQCEDTLRERRIYALEAMRKATVQWLHDSKMVIWDHKDSPVHPTLDRVEIFTKRLKEVEAMCKKAPRPKNAVPETSIEDIAAASPSLSGANLGGGSTAARADAPHPDAGVMREFGG